MQDKPDRQELEKVIGILAEQKVSWPDIRKGIEELAEPIPGAPGLQNYGRMYAFFTRHCLTSSEIKVFILAAKGSSNDEISACFLSLELQYMLQMVPMLSLITK